MDARRGSRFFLFCFLLFVALPSWLGAQAPPPKEAKETDVQALQKQLDALRSQMADLEGQIKKLTSTDSASQSGTDQQQAQSADKSQSAQTSQSAPTAQTSDQGSKTSDAAKELGPGQGVGKATEEYRLNSQDQEAAARYDNAPLDPKYPDYFRLPGTRTFLKIGGYAKSDLIFDPRPAGDPERFITSSIPIPTPPAEVSNSTVSVRPSRINLDFLVPFKDERTIRFFLEIDFFGSSATTPRLRHAYAQGKNLLLGQTFSNFMDPDSGPDTLDFEGPNAQISIRNPQVRYTFRLAKSTTASISVEKPTSDVAFSTPDFTALPANPSPDGTIQLRHEWERGHVQFAALMRDVSAFLPDGRSDSVFGWGFNLTGLFKVGKDNFVYQGEYGRGIERYIQDTSGLGIDAAVISTLKPELEAVPVVGTYGGYQHYWGPKLRSSLVYGFVQAQNTPAQKTSAFHRSEYSAVNLIWSPISQLSLGTEFLYGWRVNKDGSTGNAPRIQLSAKYNFLQKKSAN